MTARLSQSDLNSHMAEFPFQKIVHGWKNTFFIRQKDCTAVFAQTLNTISSLIIGMLGKKCEGKWSEGSLNK